jgi:predicted kinase
VASPGNLARRWQLAVDALAQAPEIATAEQTEELAQRQREFLAHGVELILDRLAGDHIHALHGALRCDSVSVRGKQASLAAARPKAEGDSAEDIADLAIDLRACDAAPAAERLIASYALYADDYALLRVVAWYERLAGCVRATQCGGQRGRALVEAALGCEARDARVVMIAVGGGVACGKTSLAQALTRETGWPRVVADRVRGAILEPVADAAGPNAALSCTLEASFDERVYAGTLGRASEALASRRSVVVDGCFPTRRQREAAGQLAESLGSAFVFVACRPDPVAVAKRLQARDVRDGVTPGSWQALASDVEGRCEDRDDSEPGATVRVATDGQPQEHVRRILAAAAAARGGVR